MIYKGYWPGKQHVLHKCDVPGCVNPDHLFLGNNAINMKDKVNKKRQAKRTSHGRAKLTEDNVASIRSSAEGDAILAERFGVSPAAIWFVRKGITWR